MAFGKLSKQDLIDAGLDPDKLKEFQEKGMTKDDLNVFKTEITTTLESFKTSLAELTTKLTTKPNTETGGNQNNDGNNSDGNNGNRNTQKDLFDIDPMEFNLDPGSHLKNLVGAAVNDSRISTMALRRDLALDRLKTSPKLGKYFSNDTLRAEFDAEYKKYTPQAMVQLNMDPERCANDVLMKIVGQHMDDINTDTAKKEGKFNLVQTGGSNRYEGGSGGNSGNNGGGNNSSKKELTENEKRVARNFGMTEEEYSKEKDELIKSGQYVEA